MFNAKLLMAAGGGDPLNGVMGPVQEYHGFKLQRHISDMATVITYKAADATIKRMAVLDAKFRNAKYFANSTINAAGLDWFNTKPGKFGQYIIDNYEIANKAPMPATVTNDAIFANWADLFRTDKTARENCDIWMSYNNYVSSQGGGPTGVPAVAWCRSQTLAGKPCDLGNEYQTIIIFACGDKLDEMDKSAAECPGMKLGYTATDVYNRYGRVQTYVIESKPNASPAAYSRFSSTLVSREIGQSRVRGVSYIGEASFLNMDATECTVVPILELDS